MALHEALDVEEADLLLTGAQQLLQGRVGQDDALVLCVEQAVLLDVSIQLAGDLGARHLGALGHRQENAQLIRDLGGLGEAGRRRAGVGALLLGLQLGLGHLVELLLGGLELDLDLLHQGRGRLNLGCQLEHGIVRNCLCLNNGAGCGDVGNRGRGVNLGRCSLCRLHDLCRSRGSNGCGGGRSDGRRGLLDGSH